MVRALLIVGCVGLGCFLLGQTAMAEDMGSGWDAAYARSEADRVLRQPTQSLTPVRLSEAQGAPAWVPTAAPASTLKSAPRKRWSVVLGMYMWASDIDGTAYADGEASDIDIAFSDLFDKLEAGFMGYAEGRYDRWSLAIDGTYVSLKDERQGLITGLDFELEESIVDVRLGYTLLQRSVGSERWGCCCVPRCLTVDAIVGARHWTLEQEVDVAVAGAPIRTVETEVDWWDPYVGVRVRWPFAPRWGLTLYADVGGFDIDDASESTWQLQAILRYHVTRGFFIAAGYRVLGIDRVEGSGPTQNGIDATLSGPILGIGYVF